MLAPHSWPKDAPAFKYSNVQNLETYSYTYWQVFYHENVRAISKMAGGG